MMVVTRTEITVIENTTVKANFFFMELPIYNLLPRSNKQLCGERRREGVVIHR